MPTLEELVDENDRLSLQVKRLIRAESRLYSFQEELEKQRSLFKKLSVAGTRLNVAVGTALSSLGVGPPPARIPAGAASALGSYLGCWRMKRSSGQGCMMRI